MSTLHLGSVKSIINYGLTSMNLLKERIMKNIFLPVILSIGLASVSFTTMADEKSTLQADLNAGAVSLTAQQIGTLLTNNTMKGKGWYTYYSDNGLRTVLRTKNNEKVRTKWWLDDNKGLCAISVRTRTTLCGILYKIGNNTYRFYDENDIEIFTVSVLEGYALP